MPRYHSGSMLSAIALAEGGSGGEERPVCAASIPVALLDEGHEGVVLPHLAYLEGVPGVRYLFVAAHCRLFLTTERTEKYDSVLSVVKPL